MYHAFEHRQQQIADVAAKWVESTPAALALREQLQDVDLSKIPGYVNTPDNRCSVLSEPDHPFHQANRLVIEADSTGDISLAYYRLLAILQRPVTEVKSGWISKSIIDSTLQDAGKRTPMGWIDREHYHAIRSQLYTYDYWDAHQYCTTYDVPTPTPEQFEKPLAELMQAEAFEEIAQWVLHMAHNTVGSEAVARVLAAETLCILFDRVDIGPDDLESLEPMALDTLPTFLAEMAPRVDVTQLDSVVTRESALFKAIKPELSRHEIFSYCCRSQQPTSRKHWQDAMTQFAAITGEVLSYPEAKALKPSSSFSLTNTAPYARYMDRRFDSGEAFDPAPRITVRRINARDNGITLEDEQWAVEIEAEHPVISDDDFARQLERQMESVLSMQTSTYGIYTASIQGAIGKHMYRSLQIDGSKQVSAMIETMLSTTIRPGDTVEVSDQEEAEYLGITTGEHHTVIEVDTIDNNCRLYGVHGSVSLRAVTLVSKRQIAEAA